MNQDRIMCQNTIRMDAASGEITNPQLTVVDMLNPAILAMYQATDFKRINHMTYQVTFPTMGHAASWAASGDIESQVTMCLTYNQRITFSQPVTVTVYDK